MQTILFEKLRSYIHQNNPDLFLELQQDFSLTTYLETQVKNVEPLLERLIAEGKPIYIIEELCMKEMTAPLRPSKFNLIIKILEEEFEADFERMRSSGILTYEAINLIHTCTPVFETLGFTEENEDDPILQYALAGAMKEYLDSQER